MKSLKLVSFFVALFAIGISVSFAQNSEVQLPEEYKAQIAESMKAYYAVLDLSAEQKTEFESITKKYAAQMIEVRDGKGGKWQKYKKVKAIRKDKDKEMKQLLSDDQYEIYLEKQEEIQAKMKEKQNQS